MEHRKGYYLHIVKHDEDAQKCVEKALEAVDTMLQEHGFEIEMMSEEDLVSEFMDGVVLFKIIPRKEEVSADK
jgi:hypothetical protein